MGYYGNSRFENLQLWLLYLSVFTLPMFIRVNNIILGAFIFTSVVDIIRYHRWSTLRRDLFRAWPVIVFFALSALACLRSLDWDSWVLLERYWSFLLIPVALFSQPSLFRKKRRELFLALTYGCLATVLVCFGNLFLILVENGESLRALYQASYVGQNFTRVMDSHPAYLGLFILTAIVFLLNDPQMSRRDVFLHVLFLILGLFQLAGRMAFLLFLILLVFLLVLYIRRFSWQILILLSGILLISAAFINYGSNYMVDQLFSLEAYTDKNRIQRWNVSYDIFRENPLIGVGYKSVRDLRKEQYVQRELPFGWHSDYNAHNQFLEYLSTNGAIGGFIYVLAIMYLLFYSLARNDLVFVFIFAAFLIANMTESMLVRIQGIEYFAIFGTLFLIGTINDDDAPIDSNSLQGIL